MTIGKKIRKRRNEKGFTQVQLAEKANISRSYLAGVELDRYNPSLDTLRKLAESLGTTAADLLGENATILEIVAADNNLDSAYNILSRNGKREEVELPAKHIENRFTDEEQNLVLHYRQADLGTQAAVRKLLDIPDAQVDKALTEKAI